MIQEFIGEFMFHPAPLEVSGNTCSHNCIYCFANIRKSSRLMNLKGIIKQINKRQIKTFADALINEGYPICISNKTDPFSKTNYIQTLALAKELTKIKNGIFIQTKGGEGIDEFINILKGKEIVWYITITTLNEEIRKRIEPNAPTSQERFELAKKLKDHGYHVILAINPILEKWMSLSDVDVFCKMSKGIGIYDICTEALHLNKREVDSFSELRTSKFEKEEIEYSVDKKHFQDYVKKVIPILIKNGVNVVKLGMPYKTDFYKKIKESLGHIFPNQYDIINYAHKKGIGIYTFNDFYEVSVDNKPFFERTFKQINSYLVKANIHVWSENIECKKAFTLKEVMRQMWNNNKFPQSMQRNQAFRVVVNDEMNPVKDKENNVMLYFDYGVYPTERIINIKSLKNEK